MCDIHWHVFRDDCSAPLFSVLWLEVETQQCGRRVTVVGCQNGHVKVAVTDLTGGPSMILVTLHREQKSLI